MPHSPRDLPGRPALHTQHPLLQPVIRLHTASLGPTSWGLDKGADHTAPWLTGSPAAPPGPAQSPPGAGRPSRRAGRSRAGLGLPGTALGVLTRPGLGTFRDTRLVAGTDGALPSLSPFFLPRTQIHLTPLKAPRTALPTAIAKMALMSAQCPGLWQPTWAGASATWHMTTRPSALVPPSQGVLAPNAQGIQTLCRVPPHHAGPQPLLGSHPCPPVPRG